MKKLHLQTLIIEVGLLCNLNCKHCFQGEKVDIAINPEYIDRLLESVYIIDNVQFMGGELTLYTDVLEKVLFRFIEKGISINFISMGTNAVERSEKLVELFNWFRKEHTEYPELAIFKISADKFHLNCKDSFTEKELDLNAEWYQNLIGEDIKIHIEKELPTLAMNGNAKNLTKEDVEGIEKIVYLNSVKCKGNTVELNPICDEKRCRNERVFNCVVSALTLTPDGYLYSFSVSTGEVVNTNHSSAIGHVNDGSLYDLIHKHNDECEKCNLPKNIHIDFGYGFQYKTLKIFEFIEGCKREIITRTLLRDKKWFSDILPSKIDVTLQEYEDYLNNQKVDIPQIFQASPLINVYYQLREQLQCLYLMTDIYWNFILGIHAQRDKDKATIEYSRISKNFLLDKANLLHDAHKALLRWDIPEFVRIYNEDFIQKPPTKKSVEAFKQSVELLEEAIKKQTEENTPS